MTEACRYQLLLGQDAHQTPCAVPAQQLQQLLSGVDAHFSAAGLNCQDQQTIPWLSAEAYPVGPPAAGSRILILGGAEPRALYWQTVAGWQQAQLYQLPALLQGLLPQAVTGIAVVEQQLYWLWSQKTEHTAGDNPNCPPAARLSQSPGVDSYFICLPIIQDWELAWHQSQVVEVIAKPQMVALPRVWQPPACLEGVMLWRRTPVPMVSLTALLGLPAEKRPGARAVVCRLQTPRGKPALIGLRVPANPITRQLEMDRAQTEGSIPVPGAGIYGCCPGPNGGQLLFDPAAAWYAANHH